MADYFGFPHILDYLSRLGLRLTQVNQEQELVEPGFHEKRGE